MRRHFLASLLAFTLLALVACFENGATQNPAEAQNQPPVSVEPSSTETGSQAPEPPCEWTIEELGAIIVAAGTFWTDLWYFTGTFAREYMDFSHPEPPENIITNGVRILPASGFSTLEDIAEFLLQFYTQAQVDEQLGAEFAPFAEYGGNLYAFGTRAGFSMPDWSRASHELVEQSNGRAVIKTTVPFGAWHRPDIDDIGYILVEHLFTFENGRVSNKEEAPIAIEPWHPLEVFVEPFSYEHSFSHYVSFSFRAMEQARDGEFWQEFDFSERFVIYFSRPVMKAARQVLRAAFSGARYGCCNRRTLACTWTQEIPCLSQMTLQW